MYCNNIIQSYRLIALPIPFIVAAQAVVISWEFERCLTLRYTRDHSQFGAVILNPNSSQAQRCLTVPQGLFATPGVEI